MNTVLVDSKILGQQTISSELVDSKLANPKLINSEAVELLSRLTKRKLHHTQITPELIFLASLVTMTLGVMFADGVVTESETELLEKTIEQLTFAKGDVTVLVQQLIDGNRENPVYQNPSEWLKLTASLSEEERTLLMSFAYEMSAVDGEIAISEKEYLRAAANALKVPPQCIEVLEAWYSGQEVQESAWNDLQNLINPQNFSHLNLRFISLDTVDLLSRLTERQFIKTDINDTLIFLSVLLIITWGVIEADGMQQEEEKKLLAKTIKHLIPPQSSQIRSIMETLLNKLPQTGIYKYPQEWLKLATSLSEPEKILMMSFCYEMSAVDGEISIEEKKYLQEIGKLLDIEFKYTVILESGFGGDGIDDTKTFNELKSFIHPDKFQEMDEVFVEAARYIIDSLEVLSF
ncbi:MAG: TerB family tellurite resistance protein [Cyanobacteria bacterium P01_A01_bin.84]